MEIIRQALIKAGYVDNNGYTLDDAMIRNQGLIRDKNGRAIFRIESAANGVDLLLTEYSSHRVVARLCL